MKYNEENIKKLFEHEGSIWHENDLDWFDQNLVEKLQKNLLAPEEKQKLIKMMANDQAIMNRYLSLKQETNVKKTPLWGFMQVKTMTATALALALVFTFTFYIIQPADERINFEQDTIRGLTETTTYPQDAIIMKTAPEYFVIENKPLEERQVILSVDGKILWKSSYQSSNKFYLAPNITDLLRNGTYEWAVKNKHGTLNKYSFTIQN